MRVVLSGYKLLITRIFIHLGKHIVLVANTNTEGHALADGLQRTAENQVAGVARVALRHLVEGLRQTTHIVGQQEVCRNATNRKRSHHHHPASRLVQTEKLMQHHGNKHHRHRSNARTRNNYYHVGSKHDGNSIEHTPHSTVFGTAEFQPFRIYKTHGQQQVERHIRMVHHIERRRIDKPMVHNKHPHKAEQELDCQAQREHPHQRPPLLAIEILCVDTQQADGHYQHRQSTDNHIPSVSIIAAVQHRHQLVGVERHQKPQRPPCPLV